MLVPVESGRVVVAPVSRRPRVPMRHAIFVTSQDVPFGRLVVAVDYAPVPGHPGTLFARQLYVGDEANAARVVKGLAGKWRQVFVWAHASRLLLADHSYLYNRHDVPTSEGARALRACEGSRRLGTYRMQSSDVAACFRTGARRCEIEVAEVVGGLAGKTAPLMEEPDVA